MLNELLLLLLQGSSEDNSRGTRLAGGTPDNDSYSRAVSQPLTGRSSHDSADLPPRYTPTREQVGNDGAPAGGGARGRSRQQQRGPRAVSAGRLAKEHEMLQNMWLENHGRRQQQGAEHQARGVRRSSSLGGSSRTVYVIDRATGTTYRRGRLLGKVALLHRRRALTYIGF